MVATRQLFLSLLLVVYLDGTALAKNHFFTTLKNYVENDTVKKRISPVIGLGGYNSLIAGHKVNIFGLRIGAELNKKFRIGIGAYKLNTAIHGNALNKSGDSVYYKIQFRYLDLFGDWIFYNNRWWELSMPMIMGYGNTPLYIRKDPSESFQKHNTVPVFLISGGILGYFKPFSWLGIGASVEFREVFAFQKNEISHSLSNSVSKAFDGPNWAFKCKVYVGELYSLLFLKGNVKTKD